MEFHFAGNARRRKKTRPVTVTISVHIVADREGQAAQQPFLKNI